MPKQLPNIFTLLNLVFGCIAIVYTIQPGVIISSYADGSSVIEVPEKIYWASVFIGCAAVIDFFDGFVARLLKASSAMGKQLDSLADVVSFGVAPGLIMFQFLRCAYAQQENGLDISTLWLLPAFLIPCAGAYRLARFNIDTSTGEGFSGLPIPSAGLLIASLPLIYWFSDISWVVALIFNKWFLYGIILLISYLMVSTIPMIDLKFKNFTIKDNWPKFSLIVISLFSVFVFKWLVVPVVFVGYIILSLATMKRNKLFQ